MWTLENFKAKQKRITQTEFHDWLPVFPAKSASKRMQHGLTTGKSIHTTACELCSAQPENLIRRP